METEGDQRLVIKPSALSNTVGAGPVVSVIVSCFNIEDYVGACLASIAAQTYPSLDVILVNDGSTDGTRDALGRFAGSRDGWRVLDKLNGGLSSARNAGIAAAKGEWLVFVDGDDVLELQAVERLLRVALGTGVDLVCGNHFVQSRGRDIAVWPAGDDVRLLSQREAFESALYHREVDVSAWGKIYASGLFDTLRYPEGRLYEDTYVFGEILAQVDRIAYVATPLYHYIMRSGSIVNAAWSGKQLQYVDAVERLTSHAENLHSVLARGALRRRVHARLSVLRYMGSVEAEEGQLRKDIVAYVRQNRKAVLSDPNAPSRDKVGVMMASVSPKLFSWVWIAYSLLRKDR